MIDSRSKIGAISSFFMRKLLIPLFAALALPTAVNAESYWLVLILGMGGNDKPAAFEKIEMSSMEGCQKEGNFWKKRSDKFNSYTKNFICITGK